MQLLDGRFLRPASQNWQPIDSTTLNRPSLASSPVSFSTATLKRRKQHALVLPRVGTRFRCFGSSEFDSEMAFQRHTKKPQLKSPPTRKRRGAMARGDLVPFEEWVLQRPSYKTIHKSSWGGTRTQCLAPLNTPLAVLWTPKRSWHYTGMNPH